MKANSTNEIYGGPGGRDVRTKHPPSGSVSWKPCPDARRDLARFWRRVSYGDIRGLATLAEISQNINDSQFVISRDKSKPILQRLVISWVKSNEMRVKLVNGVNYFDIVMLRENVRNYIGLKRGSDFFNWIIVVGSVVISPC
jgi:hypothetical protein